MPSLSLKLALGSTALGGVSKSAPSAPVLSLNAAVAGLMTFLWDIDDTVTTGDTLTRQVATDIGFSSVIDTTAHIITSGEAAANQISASLYQAPSNGTYYIRGMVMSATTGRPSAWSNAVTVIVSDATPASALYWGATDLQWGAGNTITWG